MPARASFTLTPVAADDITCTFSNARQPSSTMTVRKITTAGTGTFNFSGSNGFASQTVTTVAPGTPVAGTTQVLTMPLTATSITEGTPPAGYSLIDITCTGIGGTVTPDLATRTVALDAVAVGSGNNLACTFTNQQQTDVQVVKTASSGPVVSGDVVTYSIVAGNNGPADVTSVLLTDAPGPGLDCTVPSAITACMGTHACTPGLPLVLRGNPHGPGRKRFRAVPLSALMAMPDGGCRQERAHGNPRVRVRSDRTMPPSCG